MPTERLTMKLFAVLAAVAVGSVLVVATPAYADETLPRAKAELTRRIDLRLTALDRYERAVDGAKRLTDAHESALNGLIDSNRSELTALKAEVASDTTAAELRAHAQEMVYDHRVFLLVGPQVRLTIAGDAQGAALARLRTLHGTLTAKAGDNADAKTHLDAMDAALDKAEAGIGGVGDVLAIQPGPDAAAIKAGIAGVRSDLGAVRSDLKTAISEAKQVRDILTP
jgi:hypothetical protein